MNNTNIIKKIICISICITLSSALYLYICMVVTPKNITDKGGQLYYRGMGFMAEPADSLDVMIFGNSDVYSGFSPAVLFEKYGITSYASGRPAESMKNINPILKESLKTQKPGLVILEADCFYNKNSLTPDSTNVLLSPFIYHSRWKEINKKDFYSLPDRKNSIDINKGFIPSKKVYNASDKSGYMGSPDSRPEPLSKKNMSEVEQFITTCQQKNIPVMILTLPSPSSWNYGKHNAVKLIAEKYNIDFMDMNVPGEEFKADLKSDFRDNGNHMNITGAERSTEHIGKYISSNTIYSFNDKRNNNNYKKWHKVVKNYKRIKK